MGKITTKWMRFIGNEKKLVALEVGDEKWVPESAVKEAVKAERARLREALPEVDFFTEDDSYAEGFTDAVSEMEALLTNKEASKS